MKQEFDWTRSIRQEGCKVLLMAPFTNVHLTWLSLILNEEMSVCYPKENEDNTGFMPLNKELIHQALKSGEEMNRAVVGRLLMYPGTENESFVNCLIRQSDIEELMSNSVGVELIGLIDWHQIAHLIDFNRDIEQDLAA